MCSSFNAITTAAGMDTPKVTILCSSCIILVSYLMASDNVFKPHLFYCNLTSLTLAKSLIFSLLCLTHHYVNEKCLLCIIS